MKHIFLNLKRFDVPALYGGVNRLSAPAAWGQTIVTDTQAGLSLYDPAEVEFVMYLPEAHIPAAVAARQPGSRLKIGCQGVYREDVMPGGNFGAFTSNRPAAAAKALGCESVLIGHCEERADKLGVLAAGGVTGVDASHAVNRLLNAEIKAATARGMGVLYCIGERSVEQDAWQQVLGDQLRLGLDGVNKKQVIIAYEPIWSIGPGKTPADRSYITKIARFIKEQTGGMEVVYGGGLKSENAAMLASIPEIDGGLIALTRFSGEIGFYPEEYLDIIRQYTRCI